KKFIEFDADGQPVGDNSSSYSSTLGGIAKTHCPIFYESFTNVPDQTKNAIWKSIKKEYHVSDTYRKCQLKKVGKSFREYKHRLRVKHYDKYKNDDERKRNCPKGVKQDEWERFVDNESKPFRKRMRLIGKKSRQAVKSLHTSGRRGSARTIHELKKRNPGAKFTRTDSYIAIHTCKDGSFIAPERMARINAIIEVDPSSVDLDLDNDPVAQVFGLDKYGRVRGMSAGITKTSLVSSAPAKEKLHQEYQQRTLVEERVMSLEKHMINLTQILVEMKDQQTNSQKSVTANAATSNVREPANTQPSRGMQLCKMFNMHRELIAKGRATKGNIFYDPDVDSSMEMYNVQVSLILDRSERLFGSKKTFGELQLPTTVKWPAIFTRFV
ncbi:hypothetical protein IFM89_029438, partial [Coptis chinensis]